jgi:hypothetical protein
VSVRYLSGNSLATTSVARVADSSGIAAQAFQDHGHLSFDELSTLGHDSPVDAPLFL